MVKMNNKGLSLVELVVVMGIFIGVMLIMSYSFENILGKAGQQVKSAETNTAGIVGLEMLRSDLEHAGFGLPWSFSVTPPIFNETTLSADTPVNGITSSLFNEAIPRAIQVGLSPTGHTILDNSSNTNPGVAYLVIKSTNIALNNETSKKWAYVNYTATGASNVSYIKAWPTSGDNFALNDRVITITSSFSTTGEPDKRLATVGASPVTFSYSVPGAPAVGAALVHPPDFSKPADGSQVTIVYGVDGSHDLRMPYNRADYYVKRDTKTPATCNEGTGTLYKGVVKHSASDGAFEEYQLLNCVGDMQVEFELDVLNDGNISFTPTIASLSASEIRSQVKNVRVYILSHEGKKDRNYTYSNSTVKVGDAARPSSSGRTWDETEMQTTFGTDWKKYRWKVYTIVVHPKNLN